MNILNQKPLNLSDFQKGLNRHNDDFQFVESLKLFKKEYIQSSTKN